MNYRSICSNEIVEEIRKKYNEYASKDELYSSFGKGPVRFALRGHRRNRSESNIIAHKQHPESYKHSEKTKQQISKSRIKYLEEHPEKVPYLLNHSSRKSWPEEIFERALKRHNIQEWVRNYRNGIYEYDFAFPLKKIDVEIDGNIHQLIKVKKIDNRRDIWSQQQGWKILRFKATHVLRDVDSCINLLKESFNNNISNFDINQSFLMLRTQKERQKEKIEQNKLERRKQRQYKIDKILQCDIDFSKFGWVNRVAKILDKRPQKVNKWMKKYMQDFYEKNCFSRNKQSDYEIKKKIEIDKKKNEIKTTYKITLLNYLQNYDFTQSKSIRQIEKELNINVKRSFLKHIFNVYRVDKDKAKKEIESKVWKLYDLPS